MAKVIIEGDGKVLVKIAKIFKRLVKVTNEDGTPFLVAAPAAPKKEKKIKVKEEKKEKSEGKKMTTSSVLGDTVPPSETKTDTTETIETTEQNEKV